MGFIFYLKLTLKSIAFYLFFLSIGFGITGKISRSHSVFPADTVLQLAGQSKTAADLAIMHQPQFIATEEGVPQAVLYEVSGDDDEYIITYHLEWAAENHPTSALSLLLKLHNLSYYGLNFKDYEFVQVNVAKATGTVNKIICPTLVQSSNQRARMVAKKIAPSQFDVTVFVDDTAIETRSALTLPTNPTTLKIMNWNHLMTLVDDSESAQAVVSENLAFLEDATYKAEKLARRDHGEVFTEKSPANAPIIFFVSPIFLSYFVFIQRDYMIRARKRKEAQQQESQNA